MTRNIRVFLLGEAILAAFGGFILPVYVLYFRYYQVTLFEVALSAAVFEASVLIAQIPTGLFADRYGRKLSVIIGFGLYLASGALFIGWRCFEGFIAAEILFGIAEAFISGAGEALAVDSIPEKNRSDGLRSLFARRSRIRIVVISLFMVAAGYLFTINMSVTFYPVLLGGAAGMIVSFFYVANPQSRASEEKIGFIEPLKLMVSRIKRAPVLKAVFVLGLAANFAFEGTRFSMAWWFDDSKG